MATIARIPPRSWSIPVRADWIAAAALLLVTVAVRGIWFGDPVPEFDEQIYSLIGWRMTHGDLPFVDVWDRKPFGLFAIFAAAHWLMGPGPLAYQLTACAFVFTGALLVYALARPLVDRMSAVMAGALYVMLLSAYGSQSGQSEAFHTPIMLAMLWLVRDFARPNAARRANWAMLLGGLALQIKYTVLPQCLFLGAYALYGEWRGGATAPRLARRAAELAVLGVLPTALAGLLYFILGHFQAFWFANFISFFERAPAAGGRLRPDFFLALLPLVLLIGLGLYAALRLNPPRSWATYGLYLGWMLASQATVMLPATVYLYYYAALVPAAVLVGLPLIDVRARARFLPAACLLYAALWVIDLPGHHALSQDERRTEARLSDAIRPYVGAKRDCLYVYDGPAALYRTTGTCRPTRYLYPDHLNNGLEIHSLEVDQPTEIARILTLRPGVIVTADRAFTVQRAENKALIQAAIDHGYRPLITVSLHRRGVTAWVRRDLRAA